MKWSRTESGRINHFSSSFIFGPLPRHPKRLHFEGVVGEGEIDEIELEIFGTCLHSGFLVGFGRMLRSRYFGLATHTHSFAAALLGEGA